MNSDRSFGISLSLVLAALAPAFGESASQTYLLRNSRMDGTRMSSGPVAYRFLPQSAYTLKSISLGAPLQGTAASPGFSLHLLSGTWIRQPGDPLPDMGCILYTPKFCPGGPGTWDSPPVNPPPPDPAPEPDGLFKVSGKLYGADRSLPLGSNGPDTVDVRIEFYATTVGGIAVHAENHTVQSGDPVLVDKGRFSLTLGADGAAEALDSVVAANPELHVQFVIGFEAAQPEVLQPRIPLTHSLFSGTPSVLQGASDPVTAAPRGSYYRNTSAGSTWVRMTSSWVRIAP
jgi:hypothetical protein